MRNLVFNCTKQIYYFFKYLAAKLCKVMNVIVTYPEDPRLNTVDLELLKELSEAMLPPVILVVSENRSASASLYSAAPSI